MRLALTAAAAATLIPLLAACTAEETTALMEDPNAFACRERAVGLTGVDFADTASDLINTNISGITNIDVTAAGQTYRCVVDSDRLILSFATI